MTAHLTTTETLRHMSQQPDTGYRTGATMVGGVSVAWELAGAGPLVVLLHGWGGCIASMAPIRESLKSEYRVLSIDLPGFGQSTRPDEVWGSAEYAACIGSVIDDAAPGPVLAIIGHSFGGKVAAYLGITQPIPVRSLVLVGTPGVRLPLSPEAERRSVRARRLKRMATRLPGPLRRAMQRRFERMGSEDYRNAGEMRPILVRAVNEDLSEDLPELRVPTLLVFGGADPHTPPEIGRRMERLIPGSGLVVLDASGHFPYLDEPAAFARVIRSFIASMAAEHAEVRP